MEQLTGDYLPKWAIPPPPPTITVHGLVGVDKYISPPALECQHNVSRWHINSHVLKMSHCHDNTNNIVVISTVNNGNNIHYTMDLMNTSDEAITLPKPLVKLKVEFCNFHQLLSVSYMYHNMNADFSCATDTNIFSLQGTDIHIVDGRLFRNKLYTYLWEHLTTRYEGN